jgi:4-amino-4-deoxy-L-arabinose transferase-like glycosyltransferase
MEETVASTSHRFSSRSLSGWAIATIVLYGATFMTFKLGPVWKLTYHEVFFTQPAREFRVTGDWLAPRILGEANYQKPPMTSWLIAAAMAVFQSDHETVVRLPSLLANLITALVVAAIAARWYGERVGLFAGLIQLTTIYALFQSRLAEADMPLCAAITLGMLCFVRGVIDHPDEQRTRRGWVWGYFVSAVIAFLLKGPIGPALIGLPCGCFALVSGRRGPWRFLLDPVGWVVLLVGCLAWPITMYLRDPSILDDFRAHNLERFTGSLGGGSEPIFYYLYVAPLLMLPWTILLIPGLRAGLRDPARSRELWRFLACWTGVAIALISASAWKHKHYVIPALPPGSIVAALGLVNLLDSRSRRMTRLLYVSGGLLLIAAVIGVAGGFWLGRPQIAAVAAAIGLSGLGLSLVARWTGQQRLEWTAASLFATVWVTIVWVESFVMPFHDRYRPQAELADSLNSRLEANTRIDLVALIDPQVIWYLRFPMSYTPSPKQYVTQVSRSDQATPRVVVGPRAILPELRQLGEVEFLSDPVPPHGLVAVRLDLPENRLSRTTPPGEQSISR